MTSGPLRSLGPLSWSPTRLRPPHQEPRRRRWPRQGRECSSWLVWLPPKSLLSIGDDHTDIAVNDHRGGVAVPFSPHARQDHVLAVDAHMGGGRGTIVRAIEQPVR